MHRLALGLVIVVAACTTGPSAPPVRSGEEVCGERFCVAAPDGWDVEFGERYLAFTHPDAPDRAKATISGVNMQALVENAGGMWPASTEDAVMSFWQLLEEAGVAQFERLERLTGGAFRSEGTHDAGMLWHLLIPVSGSDAVGFEVRGPNRSWQSHADAFFSDVELLANP